MLSKEQMREYQRGRRAKLRPKPVCLECEKLRQEIEILKSLNPVYESVSKYPGIIKTKDDAFTAAKNLASKVLKKVTYE